MFTGIIETTGEVLAREQTADGLRLRLAAHFADELTHGQSVAVSGACLTVEEQTDDSFSVFLAEETVEVTYLGDLAVGDTVNLERALPADGRFDGHIVQGHVDGVGEVTGIEQVEEDWYFEFSLPESMGQYVVSKGSITIDGISLTVADIDADGFAVAIIPATYEITTLSEKSVGDPVHLEVDVIAKYVESITEQYA
ncbi:riboflavin synthase [Halosegnis longus]|uniref:riboflavin synthase n=1 Tax=Halosegnis longus TaxID=2216012 RepID=UPI00129E1D95|nr:riboflavin synthase [Halosegnis longus]